MLYQKMEMSMFENNPPQYHSLIPQAHFIFIHEVDDGGSDIKYNARLVSKGFSQVQGVYYTDTFAPVANMDSIRLVFASATSKRWEVHHMDVKNAFIHGEIQEEIYIQQLECFQYDPSLVCMLNKSLYDLKQAPRDWYAEKDNFFLSLGFER